MRAIVLKTRPHKEVDQVVQVLTTELGMVELLARGSKKITSKNAAHLEPSRILDIGIAPAKAIPILTSVQGEGSGSPPSLKKNLEAEMAMELLADMLRAGEPDSALFEVVSEWILWQRDTSTSGIIVLDIFILKVLQVLGFMPHLEREEGFFSFAAGCIVQAQRNEDAGLFLSTRVVQALKTILGGGDDSFVLEHKDASTLHTFCYAFAVFCLERELKDWKSLNFA